MHLTSFLRRPAIVVITFAALLLPQTSRGSAITFPGWDLFTTGGGTSFMGVPFIGVPLVSYDFGGSIGVKATGSTDTIVERLGSSVGPGLSAPVPIELVALQLVSAVPFSLGMEPADFHFLTLQTQRSIAEGGPGPASTGAITIGFGAEGIPHGTFDSFFDVYFDLRHGSLTGPIEMASMLTMSSSGSSWAHNVPGSLQVEDVNYKLNGTDVSNDFMPFSVFESHPSGAMHNVQPTPIPFQFSPGLGLALCSAFYGLGHLRRRVAACRKA